MSSMPDLSMHVLLGVGFLVAAVVIGYIVVTSAQRSSKDNAVINADDYFNKVTDENLDEKFNEYLEQEKKIEESPDILRGRTARYEWQQNAKEVDMYIPIEEFVKAKDIKCTITTTSVTIAIREEVIVEGKFVADVKPSECNWQIGGPCVVVMFQFCADGTTT